MGDMIHDALFQNVFFIVSFCSTLSVSLSVQEIRPSLRNTSTTAQLYSEWSIWSSCSSSCGLGIITRTRSCLKSAYNNRGVFVPLCHAEYSEHRICNLRSCPPDAAHPRAIQCSQYNNRTVAGKVYQEWVPVDEGPNPCELRCQAGSLQYGFGKVSSGTPCPQGVCLDGRCLRVGCDDRLGSEVVLDMCGVCGGRNAGCVHYKDVFMGQPTHDAERRSGYHEVVVLPIGARNLMMHQLVGKNYLALQDRTRGIIFNGEQHLTQYGGHYNIAGTSVQFQKTDNTTEVLTAKGPVTEELYVLVLLRTFNQGIYYEYWLPRQSHNPIRTFPSTESSTIRTSLPHLRPTKPAFAYGYGEKPYRDHDAPVFRHTSATTTSSPVHHDRKFQHQSNSGFFKKETNPLYNPRIYKPSNGFYQTFRNLTLNDPKYTVDKELPILTQADSNHSEDRVQQDIVIPNTILEEKRIKSPKTPRSTVEVSKRAKAKNYITNGRLKYFFDDDKTADEVLVNSSKQYFTSPVAIALLPGNEGVGRRKKPRRGGNCAPCKRSRDQTKHFCNSDFVIKAFVIGFEFLQEETRYELDVRQTFRNTLSLLPKEYVWSPGTTCRCPRLRTGKEYVIMGRVDNNYKKRESRLLVDENCFTRTYNLKYARRLQKLRKDHIKKCS